MDKLLRVAIESPYAGDVDRNVEYARMCMRDSLMRGEAPYASHLLYTQPGILDDTIIEQRCLGIAAGQAWTKRAQKHVFYIDYGWTPGMVAAYNWHNANDRWNVEIRRLFKEEATNGQ